MGRAGLAIVLLSPPAKSAEWEIAWERQLFPGGHAGSAWRESLVWWPRGGTNRAPCAALGLSVRNTGQKENQRRGDPSRWAIGRQSHPTF